MLLAVRLKMVSIVKCHEHDELYDSLQALLPRPEPKSQNKYEHLNSEDENRDNQPLFIYLGGGQVTIFFK